MGPEDDDQLRRVALQNAQSVYLARRRAEDALRLQSEELRITLASIGDGVISTDGDGRVGLMNAVAESLTGWTQHEALGQPITEVFQIHSEDAREPVENPALRALRDNATVTLANHTVLTAKDGSQRPIEDSGAPIRAAGGEVIGSVLIFRDVTARHEAERVLRDTQAANDRQRRLYEAILSNTPDLAYVFDLEHRFIYVNDGLLAMWGRTWADSIGKTCLELGYEPWHAELHNREIDQVAATKQPIRGEVPFNGTMGRRVYDYIMVPVLGASGEVEAVAGTTRDITSHKLAVADREGLLASERAARADAERASLVKEEFLATLSHELRTPLNAIVGWTRILRQRAPSTETLEQGLAVIDRNVRMQAQLIADLLDMSGIMSGKMRIALEPVDLRVVIEAALDSVRSGADAKGVTIGHDLRALDDAVVGDPARLQQVVWNLLSNAIKFTPAGGWVQVTAGRSLSSVDITVSDSGKGIQREFLPHVFERFRQADHASAREHGGLGLGLAIVKQLVDLHGGNVGVTSAGPGHGATFIVRLPVASTATSPRPLATERSDAAPTLSGVRVLVLEDEPDARDLMTRVLEECGARVVATASADEALAAIAQAPPDVIVSDIGMPRHDGYAFIQAVRSQGLSVPAAAVTACARPEDRAKVLDAGYQTHIAKPVEPGELVWAVAALVQNAPPTNRG